MMDDIKYPPPEIPLMQKRFEFEWLLRIFKQMEPMKILELGTASGGTLWGWINNCREGASIVAVDLYHPSYDNRAVFDVWANGRCSVVSVQGDTRDKKIINRVSEMGPFDWLFIDADHHYEAVRDDWTDYSEMIVSGGVIALHDIVPHGKEDIQVTRLWGEIQRAKWRTITIMEDATFQTCGIGVVFKY